MHQIPNKTQNEVLAAIEEIVRVLAPGFAFGCHTVEDMKQQARLFGIQSLEKYDTSRPLPNFLYTHIKNRLINFKRDNFRRSECPCKLCAGREASFTLHDDGQYCKSYLAWASRNLAKINISSPLDISNINTEKERRTEIRSTIVIDNEIKEYLDKIDEEMPVELRSYYLQMRENMLSVPKNRRDEVIAVLKHILKDEDLCQKLNAGV